MQPFNEPLIVVPQSVSGVTEAASALPAAVSTLAALVRAAADRSVVTIIITGRISFNGTTVPVRGPERLLTIRADPAACGPPSRGALPGRCPLDAGGLSRQFEVSGGARLRLENVELRGGSDVQGGSVLALGLSTRFEAEKCVFADSAAVGDGGAVLALAGAEAAFSGCAQAPPGHLSLTTREDATSVSPMPCCLRAPDGGPWVSVDSGGTAVHGAAQTRLNRLVRLHQLTPCPSADTGNFFNASSFAGSGGAVACVFHASASFAATEISGCSAQLGGGLSAVYSSLLSVSGSRISATTAALGGGIAALNSSQVTVVGSSLTGIRCFPAPPSLARPACCHARVPGLAQWSRRPLSIFPARTRALFFPSSQRDDARRCSLAQVVQHREHLEHSDRGLHIGLRRRLRPRLAGVRPEHG